MQTQMRERGPPRGGEAPILARLECIRDVSREEWGEGLEAAQGRLRELS